jgi:CelD/BcsL family acetyltransferase involved in cellulose biosynthesis
MYGLTVRSLELAANPHTPRSGILLSRAFPQARRAILEHLLDRQGNWDVLTLSQMPAQADLIEEVESLCRERRRRFGIWPASRSPYVETGGDWESYESALRRKHRSNVRSRFSRLERLGPVRLETVTGGSGFAGALEEGLRIEAAAWKAAAGSAILSEPSSALFYRSLAKRVGRRGGITLNFLQVGGRRIAFHYSLIHRNRIFLLKPGYDPEFAAYSPGSLLLYLTLRNAFARGIGEFDLAGDSDDWKLQWTGLTRQLAWLFVFGPRLRARLLHGAKFRLVPWLRRRDLAGRFKDPFASHGVEGEPCV